MKASAAAPGTILRAYRVALDPTAAQIEALSRNAGASRAAFNYHLAAKVAVHRAWTAAVAEATYATKPDGSWVEPDPQTALHLARKQTKAPIPSFMDSMKTFRSDPRYAWYPQVNTYALTSGMRNADVAWKNWLESLSGKRKGRAVGYPRFKKRGRSADSFTLYHDRKKPTLRPVGYRRINLPAKVGGSIRLHGNLRILARRIAKGRAQIRSVAIIRGGKHWWASVLVEEIVQVRVGPSKRQHAAGLVGVDWGIKKLATLSDGRSVANPRRLAESTRKLIKAQRALSRTKFRRISDGALVDGTFRGPKTPTAGRQRAQRKVGVLHAQVAASRAGHLHQLSALLAKGFAAVAIEDLNVLGMSAKPAARPEEDGSFARNGARAKAGLNKAVLDAAPGELRRQLSYKTNWYGSELVVVDRFAPTSKTCSDCGAVRPTLRLSERTYACTWCGLVMDRDLNAARNIAALGAVSINSNNTVACEARETPDGLSIRPGPDAGAGKRRRSRTNLTSNRVGGTVMKPEGPSGSPGKSNFAAIPA